MHYHPQEIAQWQTIEHLLAPDGELDVDTASRYLDRVVARIGDSNRLYTNDEDATRIGAILKRMPPAQGTQGFLAYYQEFRTEDKTLENADEYQEEKTHPSMDAWLQDMAHARPHDLTIWLQEASRSLSFTHQAMVWRDVGKWLPHTNISDFIPDELLKKKPASLLKDFSPALSDVPFLCETGYALCANGASPQHRELGDTLVRSCFLSVYCSPLDVENRPSHVHEFNSVKAFSLLKNKFASSQLPSLFAQLNVRVKRPSVNWDALSFTLSELNQPDKTDESVAFAHEVMEQALLKEEALKKDGRMHYTQIHALASIYNLTPDEGVKTRILETLYAYGSRPTSSDNLMMTVLNTSSAVSPPLFLALAQRIQEDMPASLWTNIQTCWTTAQYCEELSASPWTVMQVNARAQQLMFNTLTPEETLLCVEKALQWTHSPSELLKMLSQLEWNAEKMESMRASTLPAQLVLRMLYSAIHQDRGPSSYSGALPDTDWQPLPFLRQLYPEHKQLWRTMELSILNIPDTHEDDHPAQYKQVMTQMFNMFTKVFLKDPLTFEAAKGIIGMLDVTPEDYFGAHVQQLAQPTFELPAELSFEMNS